MTHLCVPLTATTCAEMAAQAVAAREGGAEMAELRLDHLTDITTDALHALMVEVRGLGIPVIATCRVRREGGQYAGTDSDRLWMFEAAGRVGLEYIDIEFDAWQTSRELRERIEGWQKVHASDGRFRLILSAHDFERTPSELEPRFEAIARSGCDVPKIACKTERVTDALRILDLLHGPPPHWDSPDAASPVCYARDDRRGIAIGMGEPGILTRVLAKKLGAFLTFASLEAGKESAPGQVTVREMRELYRWDSIGERTKVCGVIGCPVAHSMSPAIHNAAFGAVGFDGVYLPLRVEPDYASFAAFVDACLAREWLDVRGFSVTIPHKENLLRYVRERGGVIEPLAERIGVANTLVIEPCGTGISPVQHRRDAGATVTPTPISTSAPDGITGETPVPHNSLPHNPLPHNPVSHHPGPKPVAHSESLLVPPGVPHTRLAAYNTDYTGAIDALCAGMQIDRSGLRGMHVCVLGAGGVSRAIVAGLRDCGAHVTITNRTTAKAASLAEEFGCAMLPWGHRGEADAGVIINCTSIGMWPQVDETPLPAASLANRPTVFDTIYNPIETRLLREARERGCRTIDGVAMFVNQAVAQFERWTGAAAPRDLMRQVVIGRLSRQA